MFYQIFLSPHVKRSATISNKRGIYELPNNLPNKAYDPRILETQLFAQGVTSHEN